MMKKNNDAPVVSHELHHNELSESTKKSMGKRIISAIVMIALFVPAIILGDWIFFVFMFLILAIACFEILGCAGKRTFVIYIIYVLFVALIACWPLFKGIVTTPQEDLSPKVDGYYFAGLYLPITIVVVGFFLLFWLTVIYKDFSVVDASFLITMAIVLGLGFQCIYFLRYFPVSAFGINGEKPFDYNMDNTFKVSLLLLFVILSTVLTDVGAYFVGVFFGKHKMNERISPKKTWEGFYGGIIISFILTSSIGLVFAALNYPILPFLDLNRWYLILILSFITPFFATLGDFVFSAIKRYWGIKDYGNLIPGHGGVLDRLDSLFFASIVSGIFVSISNVALGAGSIPWEKILV